MNLAEIIAKAQSSAAANVEKHKAAAAKARVIAIKRGLFPKIQVTAFVAPSPDVDCDDPDCIRTSPNEASLDLDGVFAGAKINLIQPAFTFGKLTAARSAAKQAALAAKHAYTDVAEALAVRGAKAYFAAKLARELVWMLEEGDEKITSALKKINAKLEKGERGTTLQDRLRVETLQAEVQARLSEAHAAQDTALAGIRALVGDAGAQIDDSPLEIVSFALEAKPAAYVKRAESNRSDIKQAKAGALAVKNITKLEKARYWPDLVVVAGVNIARAQGVDDPPSAFADDPYNTTTANLGLVMRWNLDLASQPARVRQAVEQERAANALILAAQSRATFEVERYYSQAKAARNRLKITKKGEKAARGWVASVLQSDAIGTSEAKDLADAYIAYFSARSRLLQSIYDWNLSTIHLRHAAGELSLGQ